VIQVTKPEAPYLKNHEAQFLKNQFLNDKIEKKINYTERSKTKKTAIKRTRTKFETKINERTI
jgi:hypothetical protein